MLQTLVSRQKACAMMMMWKKKKKTAKEKSREPISRERHRGRKTKDPEDNGERVREKEK